MSPTEILPQFFQLTPSFSNPIHMCFAEKAMGKCARFLEVFLQKCSRNGFSSIFSFNDHSQKPILNIPFSEHNLVGRSKFHNFFDQTDRPPDQVLSSSTLGQSKRVPLVSQKEPSLRALSFAPTRMAHDCWTHVFIKDAFLSLFRSPGWEFYVLVNQVLQQSKRLSIGFEKQRFELFLDNVQRLEHDLTQCLHQCLHRFLQILPQLNSTPSLTVAERSSLSSDSSSNSPGTQSWPTPLTPQSTPRIRPSLNRPTPFQFLENSTQADTATVGSLSGSTSAFGSTPSNITSTHEGRSSAKRRSGVSASSSSLHLSEPPSKFRWVFLNGVKIGLESVLLPFSALLLALRLWGKNTGEVCGAAIKKRMCCHGWRTLLYYTSKRARIRF